MSRLTLFSLLGFSVIALAVASANPSDDVKFNNALAVQAAMVRARAFLNEMQSQKAVDILEEQLPKVNNNPQYLSMLRDAYRCYIRDLRLAGQPELAQRYFERLCILDPGAAADATIRPKVEAPFKYEAEPVKKTAFPNFKIPGLNSPFVKKEEPKDTPGKATIRALGQETSADDPFDRKHQRAAPAAPAKSELAREHLLRGASEFKQGRYTEARISFEQAYQTEPNSLDACREQWAYCIIKSVAASMDKPGVLPGKLPELQKQVDGAIQMAPSKMMAVGQELLLTLEQRSKLVSANGAGGSEPLPRGVEGITKAMHLGQNREGWDVTKSKHFLIFHKKNNDLAERVAAIAEATRSTK
jgi:tetratricopeptide (TPR) repeat protein